MCIITATTATAIALGVSLAATAVGTGLGVVSAIQNSKVQQAQYNYQAKVAQQNQKIAENNAAMERQTGLEEARMQRIKTLQAVGNQKNALAANGVDVNYGSSLDIIEDTAMLGELDALTIQYNSEKKARNYDTQAQNFYNDSVLAKYAAYNTQKAGTLNAVSTGIQGLGNMASSLYTGLGGISNTTKLKGVPTSGSAVNLSL